MNERIQNRVAGFLGACFVTAIVITLGVVGFAPTEAVSGPRWASSSGGGVASGGPATFNSLTLSNVPTPDVLYVGPTGVVTGSSSLVYSNTSPTLTIGAAAGSIVNLRGSATSGTIVVSTPAIDVAQTWSNAAAAFTAAKINVTNTASAAGSLLQDWQVAGISQAQISPAGTISSATAYASYAGSATPSNISAQFGGGANGAALSSGYMVKWSTIAAGGGSIFSGSFDTGLTRNRANVVEANTGTAGVFADMLVRSLIVDGTNVATPGAATINKSSGSVTVASTASSVVVTDSLVAATDNIMATSQQVDATCAVKAVTPGSGTFTITMTTTCTANNRVGFLRVPIQ